MPKLQPLGVPWKIASSMSELGFSTTSFEGVKYGSVTFTGFLGEATEMRRLYGEYVQISVALEGIIGTRFYPEFSPCDSKRLDSYDWVAIPRFLDEDGSLKNHVRLYHDAWNSTNICPDPAAYLVLDSDWLRELGFTDSPEAAFS